MKPIQMKSNLRVADQVRKAINRLNTSTKLMRWASFECFDNCREQGYVLTLWCVGKGGRSFHIAFSENRNSDDIVVYCYENVAYPSNLPASESDWQDRKYFMYNQVDEAAAYILRRAEGVL